jgi:hypothetical protein
MIRRSWRTVAASPLLCTRSESQRMCVQTNANELESGLLPLGACSAQQINSAAGIIREMFTSASRACHEEWLVHGDTLQPATSFSTARAADGKQQTFSIGSLPASAHRSRILLASCATKGPEKHSLQIPFSPSSRPRHRSGKAVGFGGWTD